MIGVSARARRRPRRLPPRGPPARRGRGAARKRVAWSTAAPTLFGAEPGEAEAAPSPCRGRCAELIGLAICHRDPERHALLYAAVWRTLHGERQLLEIATDPLVHRLERMAKSVRRDLHKMHAFVRFRRIGGGGRRAVRRLVRARTLHPGGDRQFLRRAVPGAALDDPDADRHALLGPPDADGRPAGPPRGRARRRSVRGRLARLLREHVQSGAASTSTADPRRDAEEILAEPARGRTRSPGWCDRRARALGR